MIVLKRFEKPPSSAYQKFCLCYRLSSWYDGTMKALGELLRSAHIPLTFPHHSAIVTSLCTHSKECKAGSIFFGFQGQSSDRS